MDFLPTYPTVRIVNTDLKNRYPPDTEEKGKKLGNFFQTTGAPPKAAEKVPSVIKEIEKQYPSIKTWGVVGVCLTSPILSLLLSLPFIPLPFLLIILYAVLLGRQNRIHYDLYCSHAFQSRR